LEYKKATFLLESSRTKIEEEKLDLRSNIEKLTQSLKSQEMANIVLIIVSFFVIIGAFFVWFANI
jgi:cytoskeletal protein RodZ